MVPSVLLAGNTTYLVIVGPVGSHFDLRDYLSVVFDKAPQTQLSPLIPSMSDVTATVSNEDEPEEDLNKTVTPADFCGDEDVLSVTASLVLRELLGISTV